MPFKPKFTTKPEINEAFVEVEQEKGKKSWKNLGR